MNSTSIPPEIQDYLKTLTSESRLTLIQLRQLILDEIPHAEEKINYQIPAYALEKGGKRDQQIMIAGFAKHVGFYPHPSTIAKFENELKPYKYGKGSVQFPLKGELPQELIRAMLRYRLSLIHG